jgi:hypothetical protein
MNRTLTLFAVATAILTTLPSAAAAQPGEDETLVPLFLETCTRGGVHADSIIAGISAEWTEVSTPNVELAGLAQVPGNGAQVDVRQPQSVRQWQRAWKDRQVSLVFATLPEGRTHRYVCAILVPDVRNAGPYLRPMAEGMQGLGLSGRSTDLPHFQEYAGRLPDRRRARGDIFSRSRAVEARGTMHMYIAFEGTPPS